MLFSPPYLLSLNLSFAWFNLSVMIYIVINLIFFTYKISVLIFFQNINFLPCFPSVPPSFLFLHGSISHPHSTLISVLYSSYLFPLEVIYHFYGFRILCPAFQPLQYLELVPEELWSVEALSWLGLLHLPRLCRDLGPSWFCWARDSWGASFDYSQEKRQWPALRATTPTCKKM